MTTNRIRPYKAQPQALHLLLGLAQGIAGLGLPAGLAHLIRMRASQMNGCAFCLAMHGREAREDGERQARLDVLPAWRETDLFDERECAALEWTEELTRLDPRGVDQGAYERLIAAFGEKDAVNVTLEILAINAWNRINIGFGTPPEVR